MSVFLRKHRVLDGTEHRRGMQSEGAESHGVLRRSHTPGASAMLTYSRRALATASMLTLMSGAALAQSTDLVVTTNVPARPGATVPAAIGNPLPAPSTTSAFAAVGRDAKLIPGVMVPKTSSQFDSPQAFGSFGIPYTIARVQEGNQSAAGATVANRLSTTYPYRTVGRLTFNTPSGGSGYCSASLIRRSIIVTAAHCFQRFGSGASVNRNFVFTPGHFGPPGATSAQQTPYGAWTTGAGARAGSWANGTDIGSGAARNNDIWVVAINKNSNRQFIGDIVGYMSYGWNNYSFVTSPKTGNLLTAAVTTLGYPFLLDGGRIMQRTDGPTYTTTVGGAKQLWQGSSLTGGASGGPWVVNFSARNPALAGGAVVGSASTIAVIGVTSWGTADPNAPKDNYSSQFSQNSRYPNADYGGRGAGNIGSLLNTVCSSAAPGGGTYASQGYCN